MGVSFHEDLRREEKLQGPSDRAFGYTVGGVAAGLGAALLLLGRANAAWALVCGAVLLVAAWLRPHWLAWPNRLWMRLGLLMFAIVNPVVMAVLYYACVAPMGLVMKLFRKDPLRLAQDPQAQTYWIPRPPRSPHSRGMKDQF